MRYFIQLIPGPVEHRKRSCKLLQRGKMEFTGKWNTIVQIFIGVNVSNERREEEKCCHFLNESSKSLFKSTI